jgi:hypothetical protein
VDDASRHALDVDAITVAAVPRPERVHGNAVGLDPAGGQVVRVLEADVDRSTLPPAARDSTASRAVGSPDGRRPRLRSEGDPAWPAVVGLGDPAPA